MQDAIRLFEQGLRQDATNALAAFYLGEAYAKTSKQAKAQEWYAASLAADPQSEVAGQARARLAAAPRGGGRHRLPRARGHRLRKRSDLSGIRCLVMDLTHARYQETSLFILSLM